MAESRQVIDLRRLLQERFPHLPPTQRTIFPTGLDQLDQISGGGLAKGAVTEVISPQVSAGSASLIHRMIQTARDQNHFLALVDGYDSFDPQSIAQSCLRHLLWVRCTKACQAIKAADLLLRDGNFLLVIVDLVLNPVEELRRIAQTSWYRLQRLVEATSSACLVLTRLNLVSSAQNKIVLENSWRLGLFHAENAIEQLRFRIQRQHINSELGGTRSVASDK